MVKASFFFITMATACTGYYYISASPPRHVSMEEIMKAARGVGNMALAHEIAVDNDFKIEPEKLPDNR